MSSPDPAPAHPSAAPPPLARILAMAAILLAGICGGLIGYGVTDLSCGDDGCPTGAALVGAITAVLAALGVAVVAVLTLRAMGEWRATGAQTARARQGRAGGLRRNR